MSNFFARYVCVSSENAALLLVWASFFARYVCVCQFLLVWASFFVRMSKFLATSSPIYPQSLPISQGAMHGAEGLGPLCGIMSILCSSVFHPGFLCGTEHRGNEEVCQTWILVQFQCLDASLPLDSYTRTDIKTMVEAAKAYPDQMLLKRRFQGEMELSKCMNFAFSQGRMNASLLIAYLLRSLCSAKAERNMLDLAWQNEQLKFPFVCVRSYCSAKAFTGQNERNIQHDKMNN